MKIRVLGNEENVDFLIFVFIWVLGIFYMLVNILESGLEVRFRGYKNVTNDQNILSLKIIKKRATKNNCYLKSWYSEPPPVMTKK